MESRPVFLAENGLRGRAVKAAIVACAVLVLAWLVAIVVGALGFGSLPNLPFSDQGNGEKSAEPARTGASGESSAEAGSAGRRDSSANTDTTGAQESDATDTEPGGGGAQAGNQSAGVPSPIAVTPPSATSAAPGAGSANGQGRGAPTVKSEGGRGAPDLNPSGKSPGANAGATSANAGGANANAGGANAGGNGNGGGAFKD